jgi:hypothetical protein
MSSQGGRQPFDHRQEGGFYKQEAINSGVLAFLIAMGIADFLFQAPQSELMQNSRAKEKSLVG